MPRQLLNEFDVGDVWGIGPQYKKLLNRHGTNTAWSFQSCRRLGSASICPPSARAVARLHDKLECLHSRPNRLRKAFVCHNPRRARMMDNSPV
jgi:hypothetical protein